MGTVKTLIPALALILFTAAGPRMVFIPAGAFIMGSTPEQIEAGYKLDETLHKNFAARKYKWFEIEKRRTVHLKAYSIDVNLVTNVDYLAFVKTTGHRAPYVDEKTWAGYRLVHSYDAVQRFLWRNGTYPKGRGDHPVVLVDHDDAAAYCSWRGARLPTEEEWEKAARGPNGNIFPWGEHVHPRKPQQLRQGPVRHGPGRPL